MLNWPPNFWLLVFLIHSCCYCLTTATQPKFWISEVYNSFYNFTDAFVEISDGGQGNVTLSDINLELEKQNGDTLTISLHNKTTNYGGFLVLSFENADEQTQNILKNIQNETVTLKLTIPGKANETLVIDAFKKEKGWSDVISCFRNERTINSIVLVGNEPSEGKPNNCPLSPVRFDLLMFRSPFNLTLQLLSHDIDHFSLVNHVINFFEDKTLIQTFSLANYSTQNKKVNISLPINRSFDVNSTYIINLEVQVAKEIFVVLESVYFGAQDVSGIPVNHTFKTYPDTNAAQWVTPVYLQIVPSKSTNFASCPCEVSTSTYNPFVKVSSFNSRNESCKKKCNELIMMPAPPPSEEKNTTIPPTRSVASLPTSRSASSDSTLTATSVSPYETAPYMSSNGTVVSVSPNATVVSVSPNATVVSVSPNATVPTDSPNATVPTDSPNATVPTDSPNATVPTDSSNATVPTDSSNATAPTDSSNATAPTDSSNATAPTDSPNATAPTDSPNATAPTDSPNATAPTDSPSGTAPTDSSNATASLIHTSRTSHPSTLYSVVTNINEYTDLISHTRTSESLSTTDYRSLVTETTVESTATIPTTIKADSSTELKASTMTSNFSESTYQPLITSTISITTQKTVQLLYINEIKVGLQSSMNHWIELKSIRPLEHVSSYVLVLSVADQTKNTTFFFDKLNNTNKDGFLNINFKTPGADQLLKGLNSKAGVLQLFDKKGEQARLADCVAYQMEGTVLKTKLTKTCPSQKVEQITAREVRQNWTISRCENEFDVLEPSAEQNNKCPIKKFSKHVYMKILKRKLSPNFENYFLSSLVSKLSSKDGCMLSASFFLEFQANNSGKDLNIHSILAAPDQTKLNAVFMCFKSLFHKKAVTFHLGSETVTVHRCYNSSYIIPKFNESTKTMSRKNQIIAFVVALLVVFVCLVSGFVLYLRHKKKSLLGVLGMARYDADQDDLLVNMEDVGRLDTNFRNPTYSQLSAY